MFGFQAHLRKPPKIPSQDAVERLNRELLSRPELVAIFQYHSQYFHHSLFHLLKVYFFRFKPGAANYVNHVEKSIRQVSEEIDVIELFFFMLYVGGKHGCYFGPAPPFEILKHRLGKLASLSKDRLKKLPGTRKKGTSKCKDKYLEKRKQAEQLKAERENSKEWGKYTPLQPSPLVTDSNNDATNRPRTRGFQANVYDANWDSSDWDTDSDRSTSSSRSSRTSRQQPTKTSVKANNFLSRRQLGGHSSPSNFSQSKTFGSLKFKPDYSALPRLRG